ncbi:MAG: MFS transporter [Pseudomonadales bacterium]|nr:MFS transporter [Pseudomonadales bacterium]
MFYGWRLLAVLAFVYFLSIGSIFYGFSVVMPQMIEATGWSRAQASGGFSVVTLALGFGGPLVAYLIRRFSARLTMTVGGGVIALATTWLYFTDGLTAFYIGLAILGVGMAMQTVIPGTQLITNWFTKRRGLAIGIFMGASGLGAFVAAPTYVWVIEQYGDWKIVWGLMGASALISSLAIAIVVRDRPEDVGTFIDGIDPATIEEPGETKTEVVSRSKVFRSTETWTVKEAIRTSTFWIIVLAAAMAVLGSMIVSSQAVLHMKDLGLSQVIAAAALGISGLVGTFGRLASGGLADRFDPRFMLAGGLFLELIGICMLAYADTTMMAYACAAVFGLGYGLASVSSPSLIANYFGPSSYAPLFATRGVMVTVLGASGPILVGAAYDATNSYNASFFTYSALACVFVVLAFWIKPPVKKQVAV